MRAVTGLRDSSATLPADVEQQVSTIVETQILPGALAACGDRRFARAQGRLAERHRLTVLEHEPGHGARGDERAVALDLCLLKGSRHNVHINAWADWWSGFSHYTSMIFQIPSTNFRSPRFAREAITADGELTGPGWWRRLLGG